MQQVALSPIDCVFLGREPYPVEFVFVFDYALDAARLEAALAATAERFWPIAATLAPDAASTWVLRHQHGTLVLERSSAPALPDFAVPTELGDFVPARPPLPGGPLGHFRLTRVGDASVIGTSVPHCIADGYGHGLLCAALATAYRDPRAPGLLPDHGRTKLRPRVRAVDAERDDARFLARTGFARAPGSRLEPAAAARWELVRFGAAALDAEAEAASAAAGARRSVNDVVTARAWKHVAERWLARGEPLVAAITVDFRRLHPALSPAYFGNALCFSGVTLDREEIMAAPLYALAGRVRALAARVDRAYVDDMLVCLEELRLADGDAAFDHVHVAHPDHGLLVTNVARVPLDLVDFGGGPPLGLIPFTPAPRTAAVYREGAELVMRLVLPA